METDKKFMLGFCPTMAEVALSLKNENNFIQLYPFGSAAEALFYLKQKAIDGIVIGRFAKQKEISSGIEKRCLQEEGYTLICKQKGFIQYDHIDRLPVRTYLSPEIVKEKFQELRKVTYYNSKAEVLDNLPDTEVALIDWHDYEDRFELMIPVDDNGKIKKFRLPVIYYWRGHEDKVKKILK